MKKILAVYPYTILPPLGGGALRCLNLLRELSKEHDVHAIVHQSQRDWEAHRAEYGIPESVIFHSSVDDPSPSTLFDKLPRKIGPSLHYRWLRRNWRGPAEVTLLRNHHLIENSIKENAFDFVFFEHLSTAAAAPMLKRLSPQTIRILDAHNVDHILLAEELENSPHDKKKEQSLIKVTWEEHHLSQIVDAIFACSDFDRDTLARLSGVPGFTVPNGVDCDYFTFDDRPDKSANRTVVFTGWLGTKANQDALLFLKEEIWPALRDKVPGVKLDIVGGGISESLRQQLQGVPDLRLVGKVEDMRPYYRQASILLVPLRIGSGTRLKILEAMAQGNPVISTRKGAEGLAVSEGEHLLFAENAQDLSEAVAHLLNNPAEFDRMRHRARERVKKQYDWKVIGSNVNRLLNSQLQQDATTVD